MLRPLPEDVGFGFTNSEPLLATEGYKYEVQGRYHNYYFTQANHRWPSELNLKKGITVDGFSPNLNKQLHVGHLRNLAIAKSLHSIYGVVRDQCAIGTSQGWMLPVDSPRFVAFLGCSLGIIPEAVTKLEEWFKFLGYHPEQFRDTEIAEKVTPTGLKPGDGEYTGCLVWEGKKSPVVVRRSNGNTTYAYHDLAFAQMVSPTHYLTGLEQKEHFQNLGLGDKHLPMGLVLDPLTKKKMKSRDGTALSAEEALELTIQKLSETPEPKKLAWNVLAWNFLHVTRPKDVLFEIDNWTKPDAPGLYITYTYARIRSALERQGPEPVLTEELLPQDLAILGLAAYYTYWKQRAADLMDPCPLANYTHELARALGNAYHSERIKDGRPAFRYALIDAFFVLFRCMSDLGMFTLDEV